MKELIKKILPTWARDIYQTQKQKYLLFKNRSLKDAIIDHLEKESLNGSLSPEKKDVLDYLYHNPLSVFPNSISQNYNKDDLEIYNDDNLNMNYVILNGKRLYFKRKWSKSRCIDYINSMRIEQDEKSPHCYLSRSFNVKQGDIVADIGAAEGFFPLGIIEFVQKVYLFEPDSEWIEPLQATFRNWPDKVVIIPKYVSDINNSTMLSLDDFFQNKEKPTFIKADIEGFEWNLLNGASELLNNPKKLRIALCTYHKQNDEERFSKHLSDRGFTINTSNSYMIFYLDKLESPFLRRGVIRASKLT